MTRRYEEEIDEEHPDFGRRLKELLPVMGKEARRQAFLLGIGVTELRNGKVVKVYTDGSVVEVQMTRPECRM